MELVKQNEKQQEQSNNDGERRVSCDSGPEAQHEQPRQRIQAPIHICAVQQPVMGETQGQNQGQNMSPKKCTKHE